MSAFAAIAPTLGKLVRLLGSDKDHEALGAARALTRVLSNSKLDLHDLANVVESAASHEIPRPEVTPNPFSGMPKASTRSETLGVMLRRCCARADQLTPREFEFICSMKKWRGEMTARQLAWLTSIYDRLAEERAS